MRIHGRAAWGPYSGWGEARCVDVRANPEALASGVWFVVADFEGRARAWTFEHTSRDQTEAGAMAASDGNAASPARGRHDALPSWQGPAADSWTSSLSGQDYRAAVDQVRAHVHEGEVYQANICRVLSAPLPNAARRTNAFALADVLTRGNPAPYAGVIQVDATFAPGEPSGGALDPSVWVVGASPELFIRIADGTVTSSPIKGTARVRAELLAKDEAENVMITDLVRNDLQQICTPGSVRVPGLLDVEEHPGLVHLVSTVSGTLLPGSPQEQWARVWPATFPPGSVSGAPKQAALDIIRALEPVPRGPYCGAIGWIDGDAGTAELAVGIRTFWADHHREDVPEDDLHAPAVGEQGVDDHGEPLRWRTLHFGTGAGITWESDPEREWLETELKASRLIALASGEVPPEA